MRAQPGAGSVPGAAPAGNALPPGNTTASGGLGGGLGAGTKQARGLDPATFVGAGQHGGGAQLAQALGDVGFGFLCQRTLQQG